LSCSCYLLKSLEPLFCADCELAQVSTIMNVLGSYQPELWGGADLLPDYGKILLAESGGIPLPELFADSTPAAIDVLAALLSCAPLCMHHGVWFCSK
jgi:hypothetical protein